MLENYNRTFKQFNIWNLLIEEKENIQFKIESKNKKNLDLNIDSKEIKEEEIYDINFLDLNIEELDKLDI